MHSAVQKDIEVNASASKVWRLFTDPLLSREMGGTYDSDWNTGSSISWVDTSGAIQFRGVILHLEPEQFLQHSVIDETGAISSVITYNVHEVYGSTSIHVRENFMNPIDDASYNNAMARWDLMLKLMKETAEKREPQAL